MRTARRLALAGTAFGAVTAAAAALALTGPPAVYLPAMGAVLAGEAALVVYLLRNRMRDSGVASPLQLLSRRRLRAAQRETRALANVRKWEERLDAGFATAATPALRSIAADGGHTRTVRRAAAAALARPRPAGPGAAERYDVVIASNFNLPGGTTSSNLNEIAMLKAAGLRVGLVHNPLFEMHPGRPLNAKVLDAVDGDRVRIVGDRAKVSCDLLLMRFPPFASQLRDDLPEIDAGHRMLVVNQAPMTYYEGGVGRKRVWDVDRVHRKLTDWIGEHRWVTVGPLVHQALLDHHADELEGVDLSADHWYPSIDLKSTPVRGDHPVGDVVTIGRHSRDHLSKWPELATHLRACYPADPGFAIRVLGGVEVPRRIMGRLPSNWTGHAFDEIAVGDFLRGLDVYVYYTCSSWLEAFGRAPVEAMAAGVPVVLPPVFKPAFGSGALYAEPADVAALVTELTGDHDRYLEQREAGFETTRRLFSHEAHSERFRALGLDL
ncbi:glycosyltransferase family protein [Glycomyces albidus]|uniref:Glycosyltransferase family 1 protein n=1 Tax=Glycomyces albidus TaxID=2656774 RepID=A0A6L5GHQ9_9ACTN|nr:glycosyltransferase [Glycomyces albidus]MQM28933.1 glycosyltransferase family 1 protein [Glycomyces albidus]